MFPSELEFYGLICAVSCQAFSHALEEAKADFGI